MEKALYIDVGCQSLNKYGENICGDSFVYLKRQDGSATVVMADGLGTGKSANKLSTITAQTALQSVNLGLGVNQSVKRIKKSLPPCEIHNIAYSTFTIVDIDNNLNAKIVQYDNPYVILLRDGKHVEISKEQKEIKGVEFYYSEIKVQENDIFVVMSDGAVYAGVGKSLNFGWSRDDIIGFLERLYKKEYTAKMITTVLLDQCMLLYEYQPGDDTTVCTIKIRAREQINLLLGPPSNSEDDEKMLSLFFSNKGKHIVCGGSTSTLVSRYLDKELYIDINGYFDPGIPPTAELEGVDLVTEGIITISKVLFYAKDYLKDNTHYMEWSRKQDGASQVAKMLFEQSTDINFFVGRAVNVAHQGPDPLLGFDRKMKVVEELSDALREMGKTVNVCYF